MPMSEGVWKALDIVVKGIGAAVIAAGITFYGIRAESAREEIAEANLSPGTGDGCCPANAGRNGASLCPAA